VGEPGLALTAVEVDGCPYVTLRSEAPGMVGKAVVACDEFTMRMSVGVFAAGLAAVKLRPVKFALPKFARGA
jgi:hypothetical protein